MQASATEGRAAFASKAGSTSRLTPESIRAMTSEQAAQEAASRAGLQFTDQFQKNFVSQIKCGSYQTDWTAENLPNILKKMTYFVFHPADLQPIIDALVAMREEADSLVPHAFVRASDARLPADLPAIISVHFANVAAPLVVSSLESLLHLFQSFSQIHQSSLQHRLK